MNFEVMPYSTGTSGCRIKHNEIVIAALASRERKCIVCGGIYEGKEKKRLERCCTVHRRRTVRWRPKNCEGKSNQISHLALSVDAASALALFQKDEGNTLFLSHLQCQCQCQCQYCE